MDVERLKKINKLSLDLKKHGIAESTLDAIKKAEEYIPEKEMREVMQKTREAAENSDNRSTTEQYQILLERNNRKISQEIQALNETICGISAELELLKSEIAQLKKSGIAKEEQPKPKAEKQSELKANEKKEHPRQGNYTPDDVSIEKMFYFGKK